MVVPRTTRLQFLVVRPGFWLSVLGIYKYTRTKMSFGYRFMVVHWTTASVFLVVRQLFWLSRAHGQPKFRTLAKTIINLIYLAIKY